MRTAEEILETKFSEPFAEDRVYAAIVESMKEYAKQAIEKQLKIAADEATTQGLLHEEDGKKIFVCEQVNPDSILNCTRVDLA